jgi:hypothetical protein
VATRAKTDTDGQVRTEARSRPASGSTRKGRSAGVGNPPSPTDPAVVSAGMRPRAAADTVARRDSVRVRVPLLGQVGLPPADDLAFLAGVGVLAVVGAVEWPVAVLLGVGHALASRRRDKVLREFGEALEQA